MSDKTLISISKQGTELRPYESAYSFDVTADGANHIIMWPGYLKKVRVMRNREDNVVHLNCDDDIDLTKLSLDLNLEIESASDRATWIMHPGHGTPDEHLDEVQDRMGHADI